MERNEVIKHDGSAIVMYTNEDGTAELCVRLEYETVWLSVNQMSVLFDRDESNIRRHVGNVFKEGELNRESNVHFLHVPNSDKPVPFYSLDVVISIGYRVKSKRGTQFRIWANRVLKEYLIKGFAVSQNIKLERYNELKDVVRLMSRTLALQENLSSDEYDGLLAVVNDYVYALDVLDSYDYQSLSVENTTKKELFHATYESAKQAIDALRGKFGSNRWFANEKDESFKSSIGQIYQTFGGNDLYPSVEEKAAMLLYLVVKNHSFSDGNKRIAAMLFLWFMEKNGVLYGEDGRKRIGDNTLVALTLMIAESKPEEKDVMVKVVVNLINQENK